MQKCFTVKLWKVMKICAAQTLIALTLCGISIAHSNYAQILDKEISITLENVPFQEALKKIEEAANVKFAFSIDQIRNEEPVTIHADKRSLRMLLNDVMNSRNIHYKVHERENTITLKKYAEHEESDQSFINDRKNFRQQDAIKITGTVTDARSKQSMAGVNIIVRGTTEGTTSDSEGNFTIEADEGDILVFSFIGYAPHEVKLAGQTFLMVELQEDIASLKEVVVNAGYWTVKREEQTGNIVRISSGEIESQPVMNSLGALQGRVTGLEVTQQTGLPGGNFKVRIRGQNSISSGNDPLYVIDGVPFVSSTLALTETTGEILTGGTSPLNSLNAADIESIEVLKDADATAIYGSRGANGVILITTKKGVTGKTKVDLNLYQGFSQVGRKLSLLNTDEYLTMRREAFRNDGIEPTAANAPDLFVWDTTRYTDWQKVLIGETASTTDAQLNISGGDKQTQFVVGTGFHRETLVFPGDFSDKRISAHMNLNNTSANGKLKTTFSANYSKLLSNLIKQDLTMKALTLAPNAPALYDDNGNLNWENSTWDNPLSFLRRSYEGNTSTLLTNATVSYSILRCLEVRANMGYTSMKMDAITITPKSSFNPAFIYASASSAFSTSNFENWILEPQLNWKKDVGQGSLNVLFGASFLNQESSALSQSGYNFLSESLMKNLRAAASSFITTNRYSEYRYTAAFGRLNYTLADKYIVNLTGRRDGSSRFGPGKQFANFGAAGLAWIFSKEDFVANYVPFLSFGKLRTSYGITGNDQIGDYAFLDTYSSTGQYMGVPGLAPTRLYNAEFGWETNRKFEAAIDLGLVDDRFVLTSAYYNNRSSDLLVGYALPPTAGFSTIQGNLPAIVKNEGWEFEVITRNIAHDGFTWTTSLNVTLPRNSLVEFPELDRSAYANQYVIGEPLNIAKLYNYTSIDPTTGFYQYEDVNGDGGLSALDRQTAEFIGPEMYGGLRNTITFRGFEFDFTFQFVKQSGYNYMYSGWYTAPGGMSNQPKFVMDRWTPENTDAAMQAFSTGSIAQTAYSRLMGSSYVIDDASFVRLKNLSVSYSMPATLMHSMNLSSARVFLQGQNLLTFTRYEGLDPESQTSVLPPLRTVAAGFHLSF